MASFTAKPTASDIPPSVEIRLSLDDDQVISTVSLYRILGGVQTLVRRQPTAGSDGFVAHDYEAPYNTEVTYRAALTFGSDAVEMISDPITVNADTGWLIHPANPAKSVILTRGMITGIEDMVRRSNAVRHDVLRSRYPIYTIPSSRQSREFSLKLRTKSWDQESMLSQLLDDQIPILFNPLPSYGLGLNPMFLQVMDMQEERYAQMSYTGRSGPAQWRNWTLPCVEVDSPAVAQQAVGWTYADLLDENQDYARILTDYATYADLQAHEKRQNV